MKVMQRRAVQITILAAICLAAGGSICAWWLHTGWEKKLVFRTAPVKRSDLTATISAAGTVEPEILVSIGAQVAGVITNFGKDGLGRTIDYGSRVEKGTILAKIDDSIYVAAVRAAKAQLQQAMEGKLSADANVVQMKALLFQATQDWGRAQKLGPSDALSKSAYDQYQANYEVAKANVAVAVAAVDQAKASVAVAKAGLLTAQINYNYCTIASPIKGVIIDRQVYIGQTIVSSLSAPSLFLMANDLKRILVWASVNEADIGSISIGQPVTLTVEAYPGRVFHGRVGKIRLNATMTSNVVTYTVEIITNNENEKLLPYLTSSVKFTIGRRQGVLVVPNAALHWSPRFDQIAPNVRQTVHDPGGSSRGDSESPDAVREPQTHGTLWIVESDNFVRPVSVTTGLTNGTLTEIIGSDLREGLRVVIGEGAREATVTGSREQRSPFMPQAGWGSRQNQNNPGTPSTSVR